jgi:hypothetical protein
METGITKQDSNVSMPRAQSLFSLANLIVATVALCLGATKEQRSKNLSMVEKTLAGGLSLS